MATKINYTKLNDGTWGAFVPSSLGKVVIGEDIIVTKRDGDQNWHTVATIVDVTRSGTIVTLEIEKEETEVVIETVAASIEAELKVSNTKSNVFKIAHKLTKATIKTGDSYQVNFGAALRYVLSVAKSLSAIKLQTKKTASRYNRAQDYDDIMNEGYSDAGNLNPYRQYA